MNKSRQVRFRPGSRFTSALGVSSNTVGTVPCKYLITNRIIGSPERVDVKFDSNKIAWGVPVSEFVVIEAGASDSRSFSHVA